MKLNMNNTDRVIRILTAILIAVLYLAGFIEGTLGIVLMVVAGVFLLTAFIRFCPLYTLFGISTLKNSEK